MSSGTFPSLALRVGITRAPEHRQVVHVELLAAAQVHVDAARQTGVEAAHRPHDVDALELVRAVLLEDRRVLHGVLIRPRRAVHVTRAGVPRRGRIGMVVGDFAVADDDVVRQHAAHRLVEAAADGVVRHLELRPGPRPAGVQVRHRLLGKVQRRRRRVGLEISPGAVALDGVAPFRDLPLELHLRQHRRLGQVNLDAVAGRLDVADVHKPRQRRGPEPGDRAAAGVQRQVVAGARVEPARRHDPGVLAVEVAPLRPRRRRLVPRVVSVHRVAQRVGPDEHLLVLPAIVVRRSQKDADAEVDVHEVVRDRLAVHDRRRA